MDPRFLEANTQTSSRSPDSVWVLYITSQISSDSMFYNRPKARPLAQLLSTPPALLNHVSHLTAFSEWASSPSLIMVLVHFSNPSLLPRRPRRLCSLSSSQPPALNYISEAYIRPCIRELSPTHLSLNRYVFVDIENANQYRNRWLYHFPKGYWKVNFDKAGASGKSVLGSTSSIIDTGTTLVRIDSI